MTDTAKDKRDAADFPFNSHFLFESLLCFTSDPVALCISGVCTAASTALVSLAEPYSSNIIGSHVCDVLSSVSNDHLGLAHLRRVVSGEVVSSSCSLSLQLESDSDVQATATFNWLSEQGNSAVFTETTSSGTVCFVKFSITRKDRVRSCVPYSATPYLHYPEPVIVISPEARNFPVLFANEAFLTVTGLSYNDVVGRSISLLHTGGLHSRLDDLQKALCASESCFVPMALIRKGADALPTYLQLEPIKLNGRLVHYIGLYKPASSIQLSNAAAAAVQVLDKGVWISSTTENSAVVYCNNAHTKILGKAEDDIINKPWNCWQDTLEDRSALKELHAAMAEGTASSVEVARQLEGGGRQWLECSVTPICSPSGTVDYYMGMVADITTRKQEQHMLHLMRGALEATQHAITIIETSGADPRIIYCNRAFEQLSGYPKAQVLGRSWSLLNGPNTDPAASGQILDALQHHSTATVELVQYKYNGRKFWDQVCISPVSDGTRCVDWAVVVQQDSTERKAAEAAFLLRDHALSNLSEGITIADPNLPDSPIVYVNDAFLQITGYSKEEVLGRNCRFLQGPETDMDAVDRIRTATRDGCGITIEILNYRKNGEKFWNLLSITPVKDKSGRLMSLIGVQSNITELIRRKEAEKQLLEAKIAAETATEAKSMFLANMSHEIRTPLNGMIATTQLLLASAMSPEQRELTETILESGDTLLGILGDILDFSKIDHGSVVLQNEPVDLRQTIEACIEIVASDAHKKRLNIAYTIAESVATKLVVGDSIRIRQVLVNILSNAVKFTEKGEVVVQCGVEPVVDATDGMVRIHIAVLDTGIGICEESAKKLFQCFRQGHESMSRKYGGTGLGLAISKRLAELMNGTIWVESEVGVGSTFHFTMLVPWAPRGALPESQTLPGTGVPGESGHGALVLKSNDLNPAERSMLVGRTVLVDVSHGPTAEQVMQSCRLLGMNPENHSAMAADNKSYEMAVISIDRTAAAIRTGWKGRPVVALGSKDALPIGMHPLVMVVSTPVKHSRLATALVKSTALLKWQSNRQAPKLAGAPISMEAFSVFKGWRSKKQTPAALQQMALDDARRTSLDNSALDRPRPGVPNPPGNPILGRFPRTAAYISESAFNNGAASSSAATSQTPPPTHQDGPTPAPHPQQPGTPAQQGTTSPCPCNSALYTSSPPPSTRTPSPCNLTPTAPAPTALTTGRASLPENLTLNCTITTSPSLPEITIPDTPPTQPPSSIPWQQNPLPSQPPPDGEKPPRVLIAEDNKVNQKVVLKVLQRVIAGCRPDVVENGLEVLAAMERKVYDIILMDIHMPEMDGLEASRLIQERYPPGERPRIIALSADTLQVLHERCREAGIEEFITKPFRVEDLQRVMKCSTRVGRQQPAHFSHPVQQGLSPSVHAA